MRGEGFGIERGKREGFYVLPDSGTHVATTGGEEAASRAGSYGNDYGEGWLAVGGQQSVAKVRRTRIFVALKHEVAISRAWVPKLNAAIFGTAKDPFAVWGKGDAENEVLR